MRSLGCACRPHEGAATLTLPRRRFYYHQLDLEHMTAAWLFPIVPMVVTAATGGVVASVLSAELAVITVVVSYMLWCGLLRQGHHFPLGRLHAV